MKQQILELIKNRPKHYSIMIQRSEDMKDWIFENTLITSDNFVELIYSAIFQENNICRYGNKYKVKRFHLGWSNCGLANKCRCTKEDISKNVSKTKQLYTDEEKALINTKRDKSMLKKYGVTHNLKRKNVKKKLKKPKVLPDIYTKLTDKGWLYNEYILKNRSLVDIANELNIGRMTVKMYCDNIEIATRKYHHVLSDIVQSKLTDKGWLYDEYISKSKSITQIANELSVDSTTITSYLKKQNISIVNNGISQGEQYITKIIKETYNTKVINNSRKIIPPYELDIYLPEFNLAIEYNGVYWHRPEKFGSKIQWFLYHQNKEELCNLQGIQLLHLWESYGDHNDLIDEAINGYIDNDLEKIYVDIFDKKKHP